jgi:hypothetical protein
MNIFIAICLILIVFGVVILRRQTLARAEYIRTFVFPAGLIDKLAARRPELEVKDRQLVARALRQFFIAYLKSGRKFVSMPSQVVDDLWHEFILYTWHYDRFCKKAFGCFLHHTPAVVLGAHRQNNVGLRRVWWHACLDENIHPKRATRLPLLFAIDAKLHIAGGFHYVLNCKGITRRDEASETIVYCGGDMSSTDFDGSTEGFGDSFSSDSGGDGDAGGCGGCGGD